MADNMLSLISKVAQLEFEIECAKVRMNYVKEYEHCAIWEYDIANKTLVLQRKLDGRYAEDNKIVTDYQNQMHNWNLIHPDDWHIFDAYCASMDNGDDYFSYDYRQVVNNAMFVWVRNTGYTLFDDAGNPYKVIGKTLDITEEIKRKEDLVKMAEFDSLTGLLNKQSFISNVHQYLDDTSNASYGGSFYIIDIDNFKTINDTKGHMFGDEIIRKVGSLLKETTPANNYVGRIGGDEFCIFIKGKSTAIDSMNFAKILLEEASKIPLFNGINVTLSIGISLYPLHSFDFDHLFDYADWALYYAKKAGKNTAEVFFPEEKEISDIDSKSLSGFFGLISDIDNYDSSEEAIDLNSNSDKDRYSITQQVFAKLNSTYYIIDNKTFNIVENSKNIQRVIPFMNDKGKRCYERLAGRQEPCMNCPAERLITMHTDSEKSFEYKSKFGKLLRIQAKPLDDDRTLISIQDVSKYAEANARFNLSVGALTMQSFLTRLDESIALNNQFIVCIFSLTNIEKAENKIELVKSLSRGVNRIIHDNEPICLIHNDVVICQLFRDRHDSSVFTSSVIITYNAYFNSNVDDDDKYIAYGAVYIPKPNEDARDILNNSLECLKEAYRRHNNDDHYYLISDRM